MESSVIPPSLCYCICVCMILLITSCSAEPYDDKQALLDFLNKIHHHHHHHDSTINWNQSHPVCTTWTGVTCNHDKTRVTSLHLPKANLSGPIPLNTLSRLTALLSLNLRSNSISGKFPPELLELKNLTSLNLSRNRLSGSVPSSISNLTRLTSLDLSLNSLSGELPSDIRLPKLKYLNLSSNNLSGRLPMSLRKFPDSAFSGNHINISSNEKSISGEQQHRIRRRHGGLSEIAGIAIGACFLALLIIAAYAAVLWSNREKSKKKATDAVARKKLSKERNVPEASGSGSGDSRITFFEGSSLAFDLEDLLRASAEVLGKGTYGTTYKAALDDSMTVVVVKRLKEVSVGKREFQQQMEAVGRIRHDNVTAMRAYYYSRDEKLVVYDYYTVGSVFTLLHGNRDENRATLDWEARLRIAIGAARGLAYIHTEINNGNRGEVHGNIKSSNIFLNTEEYGCVSELGIATTVSSLSPPARSRSNGYLAPELTSDDPQKASQSSDVYSFGVFLLELLTGKSPLEEGMNLVKWVNSVVREEWTAEVFDVELLRCAHVEEEMVEMLQLGLACSCSAPERRPKTMDLVRMVEEIPSGRSGGSTPTPVEGDIRPTLPDLH